ncbi:MAG: hypothetical protein ACPHCT_03275, partial [Flavobacteriales bacterium]
QAPGALWTFAVVCFAWVFFRADDMAHALDCLARMGRGWSEALPKSPIKQWEWFAAILCVFLAFEWRQFRRGVRWMWRGVWRHPWVEAVLLLVAMVYGTRQAAQEFIYFAF